MLSATCENKYSTVYFMKEIWYAPVALLLMDCPNEMKLSSSSRQTASRPHSAASFFAVYIRTPLHAPVLEEEEEEACNWKSFDVSAERLPEQVR